MHAVADALGIGFLALGFSPKWTLAADARSMPKSRYRIMARYMPKVGTRGLDMMFRTATVQANLDFADEADMVAKLRVGLALQPMITALFANSPFTEGKLNGFLSARSEIWRDTDAARTGMLPFAFEPGMGFERYVDYALDVPLYFVKRGGVYHDVAGASFRDLLAGRLAALPGERATISDWANHLSTIFPEVRLKRYLEMRGADVGPPERIWRWRRCAVGLYYDASALAAAGDLIKRLERGGAAARCATTFRALASPRESAARSLREIAREALDDRARRAGAARATRRGRARRNASIWSRLSASSPRAARPPKHWIARFEGPGAGDIDPVFARSDHLNFDNITKIWSQSRRRLSRRKFMFGSSTIGHTGREAPLVGPVTKSRS